MEGRHGGEKVEDVGCLKGVEERVGCPEVFILVLPLRGKTRGTLVRYLSVMQPGNYFVYRFASNQPDTVMASHVNHSKYILHVQ